MTGLDYFRLFAERACKHDRLENDEAVRLAVAVRNGDQEAEDKIFRQYYRLAMKVAKRFARRYEDIPLEDLVSYAYVCIPIVIRKFDERRGSPFFSYMEISMIRSVQREIDIRESTIKIPARVAEMRREIVTTMSRFRRVHGREQSDTELAETMGLTPKRLLEIKNSNIGMVSLSKTVNSNSFDSDSRKLADILPDRMAPSLDDTIDVMSKEEAYGLVMGILGSHEKISARDMEIVKDRFGLEDREALTLEALGEKHGLTRERVRQIVVKVVERVRNKIGAALDF